MKLTEGFNLLATAPDGIKRLRELILSLAVQGKLVPQDPSDEPASELLKKIRAEKERLIAEGKIKKDKPLPAIGDDEKPFALPEGWEWARLGAFLPFQIGKTPPTKDAIYWSETGTPWVSISDMPNLGYISRTNRTISEVGHTVFSYPPLPVGTLLMSFKLTIGKIAILDVPAYHNEAIASFRPLGGMGTDFLKWMLPSAAAGGASKDVLMGATLNTESLTNLLFPLPPLAEQSRIVAKVEELMALCDALETRGQLEAEQHARLTATLFDALAASESAHQLQENWARLAASFDLVLDRPQAVDALEQTLLQLAVRGLLVPQDPADEPASELLKQIRAEKDRLIAEGKIRKDKPLPAISEEEKPFELPHGWEWVRVGNVGVTQTGGTPASNRPEFFDGNFPFIGPGQITQDGKILSAEKFISTLGRFESATAETGDILMVCIGGSIGKCASAIFDTAFNQQINSIHPLISSNAYILTAMSTLDFATSVRSAATGSATPIISKGKWDLLLLPMPPLAEQSRIVARVEALRALCGQLRQRLAASRDTQSQLASALLAKG